MINFRQIVRIAASVPLLWGAVACSDTVFDRTEDPEALPGDRAATIEVPLRLHPEKPKVIGKPLVNDIPSRAEGDNDDEEKPVIYSSTGWPSALAESIPVLLSEISL